MRKGYKKYKLTNIDWLHELPESWSIVKLKFLTLTKFSSVDRHELEGEVSVNVCHYPQAYNNEKINSSTQLSIGTCTEKELENFSLRKGQVIITKDSETADDIGIPTYVDEDIPNAVCGYHLAILEPMDGEFDSAFLFRYLQSNNVSFYFEQNSNGVTRFGLGKSTIENLDVPFPSRTEQTQIARFLDYKTVLIDTIIAKKQKLIELLKEKRQSVINEAVTKGLNPQAPLKDSGVEWLEKVPEHWKVAKIKHVADIKGRIGFKGYTKEDIVAEGEGALTLGAKHINKDNRLDLGDAEYISWEKYYESPEIMVKKDDVIFTQRGSLGKVCHIDQDIPAATINPSMVILSPKEIVPRFLYFWLTANRIQTEVSLLQSSTAVPMISQFQLSNFPIIIPPIAEQRTLVEYIDQTWSQFTLLVDQNIIQIEKLKEYRQSLISEAVTGKIDVRDWEPPAA